MESDEPVYSGNGSKFQGVKNGTVSPSDTFDILDSAVLGIMDEESHAGCQLESGGPAGVFWEMARAKSRLVVWQISNRSMIFRDPVSNCWTGMADEISLNLQASDPEAPPGDIVEGEVTGKVINPEWKKRW